MALWKLLRGVWLRSAAYRQGDRPLSRRRRLARPLVLEALEGRLCPSLTLTQGGRDTGIVLSVFAVDFPNTGQNGTGPLGIAFPSSGGVLVSDVLGNIRRFPTDTDGQSASWWSPGQNYGMLGAVGLARIGENLYAANQQLRGVDQINDDGTLKEIVVNNLSTSSNGPVGVVANTANGHLFVSVQDGSRSRVIDLDPVARTSRTFVSTGVEDLPDGLTISADGSILYVSGVTTGHIKGYNISSGHEVFDSGLIVGTPDGVAAGIGPLAGKLFVNTNSGSVVEVDIATHQQTVIASGGSRGDFVAIDPRDGSALFTQTDRIVRFTFPFGAAQRLTVGGFPSPSTAGTPGSITVTALDQNGLPATGYTGTVHLTSSDAQAILPADYTFTAADHGTHTFNGITLKTAGNQAITVTDTRDPRLSGTQPGIRVRPAATITLAVAFTATTPAGEPRAFTVAAKDQYGNTTPAYTGTVHLISSDGRAVLEANHTFTAADQGAYAFGVELRTTGTQSLTATDTATGSITGTQAGIVVTPAAPDHFALTTSVTSTVAGTPFDVTVTVQDQFNNTVTGYRGTVTFSSQDPYGATLPPDYTFQAGDQGTATFPGGAALYTAGTWDVTATDTQSGISGSAYVNVIAAPAATFQIVAPASVASGAPFDVTVLAVDPYGNTDTNYQGTITFSTSDPDPGVVLPPDYTFQPSDTGMATFPGGVTLITPGDQALAVADTSSGITGAATVTVTAGNEPVRRVVGLSTDGTDCTDDVNWYWIDGRRTRRDRRPVSPSEQGIISPLANSRGSWNG